MVAEAKNEDRVGPVERTQSFEPPDHIRHMAAKNAAIGMHFVDDDIAQVLEECRPAGMVRQNPHMQHVGIRDQHPRIASNVGPLGLRGVAIIGIDD